MDKYYTSSLSIYAWRLQKGLPPLEVAVVNAINTLSVWKPEFPIDRFYDPKRKPKQINQDAVRKYMDLKERKNPSSYGFEYKYILMHSKDYNKMSLNIFHFRESEAELLIHFDCAKEQPFQAEEASDILGKVCRAFDAFSGGFGGEPPSLGTNNINIPEAIEYCPAFMTSEQVISRHVPSGIWWVNYWDSTQMQTLGIEKVLSAPWAKIQEVEDGAFLLSISEEWPHALDKEYPQRRLEIARHLNLRELYEQNLSGSNSLP